MVMPLPSGSGSQSADQSTVAPNTRRCYMDNHKKAAETKIGEHRHLMGAAGICFPSSLMERAM